MSRRKHCRAFLGLTLMGLLVFSGAEGLWGLYANFNRYNPVMDYVPQEIGFYDTTYWELSESDCRHCHGDSTADRHHATDTALLSGGCEVCHFHKDGPLASDGGVVVRDCTTIGCHSWHDVSVNGWHHDTDDSCVACHDPNLIDEITPFRDFETDPPLALDPNLIPSPFSCDNCHWEQADSSTGDPDHPGHPSTYDHYNGQGEFVGFHEYSKPIYGSFDTHHMAFRGKCSKCHSKDPNRASWDPYDKELIRYCETCHGAATLHAIGPHVNDSPGWGAAGFHVAGDNDPTGAKPMVYRTWSASGAYLPETTPGFASDEMCFGCHETTMMPQRPETPPSRPVLDITTAGIQPNHAFCGALVTLRGEFFGDEYAAGYRVQIKREGEGGWSDIPVYSWTETRIEFKVPCWSLLPGNYKVRVVTPTGKSNRVNFTLTEQNTVTATSLGAGACDEWITLSGVGLGNTRLEMLSGGNRGVHRVVDFVSSKGTYTALQYAGWSDRNIKTKLQRVFEDTADSHTGHRNFVQDDGSGGCAEELTIMGCNDLEAGTYWIYLRAIYFDDEDASGGLNCGDTIFQVVVSDPTHFELTKLPSDSVLPPTDSVPPSTSSTRTAMKKSGENGDGCCLISTALEPSLKRMFRP